MANQLDANVKDDLKTQFVTREGTYRLLTLSEYSRPNRVGYSNNQSSPQVRVSFVTLPNPSSKNNSEANVAAAPTTAATPTTSTSSDKRTQLNSNGATSTTTPATPTTITTAATTLNGGGAGGDSNYNNGGSSSTVDARLGGGISMHSMTNGGVLDQNGLPTNQIYGGDRICFNFGRDLYVYAFRGVKKVSKCGFSFI